MNAAEAFEQLRKAHEDPEYHDRISADQAIGLDECEEDKILNLLWEYYPSGHWARERETFRTKVDIYLQLIAGAASKFRSKDNNQRSAFDCCVRSISAPTLSPFIDRAHHNIAVPAGFTSSISNFISTTYAMSAVHGASKADLPALFREPDFYYFPLRLMADENWECFLLCALRGSSESAFYQCLEAFDDTISSIAFEKSAADEMFNLLGRGRLETTYGIRSIGEALEGHQFAPTSKKASALTLMFVACHEFGHAFLNNIDGIEELSRLDDEMMADAIGMLLFYKIVVEERIPETVFGCVFSTRDVLNAVALFHTWNLSSALINFSVPSLVKDPQMLAMRVREVAKRWCTCAELVQKIWTEEISASSSEDASMSVGYASIACLATVPGGILRSVLVGRGQPLTLDYALGALNLLPREDGSLWKAILLPWKE